MAEWKKLVVSGSNISQLNNDAGYLTAGTITQANGYATASVNGTELIAASATSSLTFASSSGQGVTLAGSSPGGLNTITVGLSAVPNTSLANSSVTIGSTNVALGATVTSIAGLTLTNAVATGSFTGSFAGDGSGLTGIVADPFPYTGSAIISGSLGVTGSAAFVNNSEFGIVNVDIAGNYASQLRFFHSGSQSATIFSSNPNQLSLSANNGVIIGNAVASGSFTGSFLGDGSGLTGVVSSSYALTSSFALNAPTAINANTASNITPAITNELDNRVLTANGGGTINGEANLTFDGTTLNITGNQIISGDLTVNGTTTTINTQNLNVADKFILLSSGSTSANDGGIIIQSAAAGTGFGFLYDSAQARWGYTGSLAGNSTSAAPDAFAAMVLDLANGSTDIAAYQKNGNIKIDTGDIYIYA
jgi:hypothetical protein